MAVEVTNTTGKFVNVLEDTHLSEHEANEEDPFSDTKKVSDSNKKRRYKIRTIHCQELGCTEEFKTIMKFRHHLEMKHMFELNCEHYSFTSLEEFENWKESYERDNYCSFVKKTGNRNLKHLSTYLYCSRSGVYEHKNADRDKNIRKTRKAGTACTASIIYKHLEHGEIKVQFYPKHYGHELDDRVWQVSEKDKKLAVSELSEGKSLNAVVKQMIGTTESLKKIFSKAKKKSLSNVTGIPTCCMEGDYPSLDEWCADLSKKDPANSSVIFYKPMGYKSDYSLASYDLCLILMTDHMRNMLAYYGNNLIYVTTLAVPKINHYATFLFVLDEFLTPFPVTIMLSNKMNCSLIRALFESLAVDLLNRQISLKTKVLMTDRDESILRNWNDFMPTEAKHMICPRFIDEEWRKYLATIRDEAYQDEIYDQLCELLEPADSNDQESRLRKLMKNLETNEMCSKFLVYFKKYYKNCFDQWGGHSLKNLLNIQSSLNFEKTVSEIQEILDAKYKKYAKNIVRILQLLLKRIVSYQHTRASSLILISNSIDNHHRLSLSVDLKTVSRTENEDEWQVIGTSKEIVRKNTNLSKCFQSDDQECSIMCTQCNICIHNYTCTCVVYTKQSTICLHIHSVVGMIRQNLLCNVLENNIAMLSASHSLTELNIPETNTDLIEQEPKDVVSLRKAIIQSLNSTQDKLYLIHDENKLRALLNIAAELHSLTCEMHNKDKAAQQKGRKRKNSNAVMLQPSEIKLEPGETTSEKVLVPSQPGEIQTTSEKVLVVPSQNIEIYLDKNKSPKGKRTENTVLQYKGNVVNNTNIYHRENTEIRCAPNYIVENNNPKRERLQMTGYQTVDGNPVKLNNIQEAQAEKVNTCRPVLNSNIIFNANKLRADNSAISHKQVEDITKKQTVSLSSPSISTGQHIKKLTTPKAVPIQTGESVKVIKKPTVPLSTAEINTNIVKKQNKSTSEPIKAAMKPNTQIDNDIPTQQTNTNIPKDVASTISSWDIELSWENKKILIPLYSNPKTGIEKIIQKLNAGHFVYKNEKDKKSDIISSNKPSIIEQLSSILKSLQNPAFVPPLRNKDLVNVKLLERREPLTLKRKIEEYSQQMNTKKNNEMLVVKEANRNVVSNLLTKKAKPEEKDLRKRFQVKPKVPVNEKETMQSEIPSRVKESILHKNPEILREPMKSEIPKNVKEPIKSYAPKNVKENVQKSLQSRIMGNTKQESIEREILDNIKQESMESEITDNIEQESMESEITDNIEQESMESEITDIIKQESMESEITDNIEQESMESEITDNIEQESMEREITDNIEQESMKREITDIIKQESMESEMTENTKQESIESKITENKKQESKVSKMTENKKQEAIESKMIENTKEESIESQIAENKKQESIESKITENTKEESMESEIHLNTKEKSMESEIHSKPESMESEILENTKEKSIESEIPENIKEESMESDISENTRESDSLEEDTPEEELEDLPEEGLEDEEEDEDLWPPEKILKSEVETEAETSDEDPKTMIIPKRVVRTLRPQTQNKLNSPGKACLKVLKPCVR